LRDLLLVLLLVFVTSGCYNKWIFYGHVDVGLWFVIFFDYFLNVFNVFCLERWESFFYPQNFLGIAASLGSLDIGFGLTCVGLDQFVKFEVF